MSPIKHQIDNQMEANAKLQNFLQIVKTRFLTTPEAKEEKRIKLAKPAAQSF